MTKKICSAVIALCLMSSTLTFSAYAAEEKSEAMPLPTTAGSVLESGDYKITANTKIISEEAGVSGLVVADNSDVSIWIPEGVTLTVKGADAVDSIGGGAGIQLPETSTLTLIGGGTLSVKGGNAARGKNGADAPERFTDDGPYIRIKDILVMNLDYRIGAGGNGGYGGGGAGAGIGSCGTNGTAGGKGADALEKKEVYHKDFGGEPIEAGESASTDVAKPSACGKVIVHEDTQLNAYGGAKATSGTAGADATKISSGFIEGWTHFYTASIGAGGGAGAGGAAGASIGTGGYGGTGGNGGGRGSAVANWFWYTYELPAPVVAESGTVNDDITTVEPITQSHNKVIDKGVTPGCTEPGLTEGSHCSVCGKVLAKQEEIPPHGHKYSAGTTDPIGKTTYICDYDNTHTYFDYYKYKVEDDGNNFGLDYEYYFKAQLLGIQIKNNDDQSLQAMRYIGVISDDLVKGADDYGFVVAQSSKGTVDYWKENSTRLTTDNTQVVSCKKTSNTLCGDYGKYDSDTSYKYITLAVNLNPEKADTMVIARVYVTVRGVTYYGPYIDGTGSYWGGSAASYNSLTEYINLMKQ